LAVMALVYLSTPNAVGLATETSQVLIYLQVLLPEV
jgi:hypothetical protein